MRTFISHLVAVLFVAAIAAGLVFLIGGMFRLDLDIVLETSAAVAVLFIIGGIYAVHISRSYELQRETITSSEARKQHG